MLAAFVSDGKDWALLANLIKDRRSGKTEAEESIKALQDKLNKF